MSVSATIAQAIAALQQSQSQTLPPPASMPRDFLATVQILGEDPALRRRPGVAGEAVFTAWSNAATALSAERHTILRGNGQVTSVGTAVRVAPALLVTDGFGRPIPNVGVDFSVVAGGGTVVPIVTTVPNTTTGQDGVAVLTSWTLGPEPGLNQLDVKVKGTKTNSFAAFGVATRLCVVLDGNDQIAAKETKVPIDPKVRVLEADTGQPVPGVEVVFTIIEGDGSIEGGDTVSVSTDSDGVASGEWTLGPDPKPNLLRADVAGADPVTFTATAT